MNLEYTAVIRTLGKAGNKYDILLKSLKSQSKRPKEIIVYIAEGYPLPQNHSDEERYVYVKKGMATQRALPYKEVDTEWILFLDDDLFLPSDSVEKMFLLLNKEEADVISPDVFQNSARPIGAELLMTISGRMRARRYDDTYGYKVMRTAGYSYNAKPVRETYFSQTNAGACFLCRKSDFTSIKFEDELWIDKLPYPLGEDQIMYYKLYLNGKRLLTWYKSGIKHLDAGENLSSSSVASRLYSDFYFKIVFWHRFIFLPEKRLFLKIFDAICILYTMFIGLFISCLKVQISILGMKYSAIRDAIRFIRSDKYKALPKVKGNLS